MSTEYIVHKDTFNEVALLEHSGKLDLYVDDTADITKIRDLTPEQVAVMALKMLKAAYYQDEEAVQLAARASRGEYQLGLMI